MSVSVDQEDLLAAYAWISAGAAAAVDCEVYVSRTTGLILWSGDGVDEGVTVTELVEQCFAFANNDIRRAVTWPHRGHEGAPIPWRCVAIRGAHNR